MPSTPNILPAGSRVKFEVLALASLIALVCLITWPGMNAPLLLDDNDQMIFVKGFNSLANCFGNDGYRLFRPVKNLIYYAFQDTSLFKWHLLNLSFYLASIPMVYLLLRRLLGSAVWAFAAVAIWATCPTQASTAVWMSCVSISLAISLSCACMICYDIAREKPGRNAGRIILVGLCLFLAQCSYESAVMVPALCVLVDALRKRPLFSRTAILHYTLLAGVTLAYLALRAGVGSAHSSQALNLGFSPDITGWQLSLSAPWFLWRHFSMWLMPAGRIEFCSTYIWGVSASSWTLAAAWAWLLGILGVILFMRTRQPWVAFGLLWFLITSFPSSNFVPIWAGPIEDYYLVVPGIGLATALLGCAKALIDWINRERTNPESQSKLIGGSLLCVGVLWRVMCIPLFWLQAGLWSQPLNLYLHCELTRPAQFHLQSSVARELFSNGNLQQAGEWAMKSYQTGPWHAGSLMILGSVALENADYEEAENRFQEALRKSPDQTHVHDYFQFRLAKTYMAQASKRHLVRETLLPLLNHPHSVYHLDAINLQLDCYLALDQPNDARRAATKAVQLHPDNQQLAGRLQDIEKKFPSTESSRPPQK